MNRSHLVRFARAALLVTLSIVVASSSWEISSARGLTPSVPDFTFHGSGWGHGIGMSQYGAQGSALAGKDYEWILGHYYSGTTLGEVDLPEVQVNIDCAYKDSSYAGRSAWTVKAVGSALLVKSASDDSELCRLSADTFYHFRTEGTDLVVTDGAGKEVARLSQTVYLRAAGTSGLIEVQDKSTSTDGGYHALTSTGEPTNGFYNVRYRGELLMQKKSNNRLAAVNVLPMQEYLYGVVPRETPASWHQEALKAQSVAARSYAYADVKNECILKCTTYSQVYKGHSRISQGAVVKHEAASTNAAVDATNRLVVKTSSGAVAKTYFHSQSGGHTANNEDVWMSGTPLSYTRGVPDPYEYRANPPYSPWSSSIEKTYSGLEIAERLQGIRGVPSLPAFVVSMSFNKADSGHVRYVVCTFSNGSQVNVSGDTLRSRLGLLSTRFYLKDVSITRLSGGTRYDTAVRVSGNAFPSTAPAVVVASGEDYPDALTGSALAGATDGALLLTKSGSLPEVTRAELVRLAPATVYIMGGTGAVSSSVQKEIEAALPGAKVTRVGGEDRYETARKVADMVASLSGVRKVIVVSGTAWADGATASALAYARDYPILLTRRGSLDARIADFLYAHRPDTVLVVGGTGVISGEVETAIGRATGGAVYRDGGVDRYETAAKVAERCLSKEGFSADSVYVATGATYADALAGGTLAGSRRGPLVLTKTDSCPASTARFLQQHSDTIDALWLFGGEGAISATGAAGLEAIVTDGS